MTDPSPTPLFIPTKAHAQFVEFVQACAIYRYIGICYGQPGVGKTVAAREFARWDVFADYDPKIPLNDTSKARLSACQAVFYTATVANTPKAVIQGLYMKIYDLGHVRMHIEDIGTRFDRRVHAHKHCPLVIVDEADRLSFKSFEQLRDLYDQNGFGLVLQGMPGLEKRLARYPQLYSRIGFVHEFKPLSSLEMRFIFEKHWETLGIRFNSESFTDVEAMIAIMRITRGNFRLINRLFSQIKRLMAINQAETITAELVDAARECLVIGLQ
jgi:DNA transposition AAA+ family ATPase